MKWIYIASPYKGDIKTNVRNAKAVCKICFKANSCSDSAAFVF